MSNTFHTQQYIGDFLKEAARGVPRLSLRKHMLRLVLARRVCHRLSPYIGFARLLVPVLMVFMIFFFGQPTPADPQVAAVLVQSNQAVKMLSKEDRLLIADKLGIDPVALLRMVGRSPDASVGTFCAVDTCAVQATTFAASDTRAPLSVPMMKVGDSEQSLVAPYEAGNIVPHSLTLSSPVSRASSTIIQFTTPDGVRVAIMFDERLVPISQTIIPL